MTPISDVTPSGESAGPVEIDWKAALVEHEGWLRSVVWSRLSDPQAVDDVMQEVSLAAVRQKAPLRDLAKLGPWLYQLAVRQSLMYRRRRGRQRKLADRYRQESSPAEHDRQTQDPLAWLVVEERRELVRKALGRLPRRDAEILLLKYAEGFRYRQIAERLGASESAIEARLHRARARLRKELVALEVLENVS